MPQANHRVTTPLFGAAVAALAAAGLLVACSPADDSSSGAATSGATQTSTTQACSKESLPTKTAGKLTIGTDKPAYEPWFSGDDPSNGKGFESAVAYAVADQLGYAPQDVTWTVAAFNSVISVGPKPFDFDINQVSITPERAKNVDFSSGYYDVTQAVITVEGNKAASATSLSDLAAVRIGAQVGTTSFDAINDVIKPTTPAAVFNSNDDAKLALSNGQIDALVVDLPTALYLVAAEIDGGKLVGQLPGTGSAEEQFGLVLDKGSPLTACVTQAVDALRADGTLSKLEQQWLTETAGAPVLK